MKTEGGFHGSRLVEIKEERSYFLKIDVDRKWKIKIYQPSLETDLAPPFTLIGGKQEASSVFQLEEGLTVFDMKHSGRRDFDIRLLDDRGKKVKSFSKSREAIRGSTAFKIKRSGIYILGVWSDSEWEVRITQPTPEARLTPPINMRGTGQTASDMFHLDAGTAFFNMEHDGTSRFTVQLLDDSGGKIETLLRENVAEGSATADIKNEGVYLLNIWTNGRWSVSIEQ